MPLRERMVVRDLVQLTRALYDLADRAAWLAVLRAPWCGARLATLTALSGPTTASSSSRRSAIPGACGCHREDLPRLARLREILTDALAGAASGPVADWLERTWMRLGASDAYGAQELEDARAFFAALAERAALFEWRGPEDFPSLLEHLYSAPASAADPVQVMTIHRAKGLQFDHVVVPALDRATRGAERRLLRWIDLPGEEGESELLIAPTPAVGAKEEGDLNLYLRDLIHRRDLNERGRLMYVAATRARRTLWLSGAPAVRADGTLQPDRRSLLAIVWPALAQRFETVQSPPTAAAASRQRRRPYSAGRGLAARGPARRCAAHTSAVRRTSPASPRSSAGWARRSGTSARCARLAGAPGAGAAAACSAGDRCGERRTARPAAARRRARARTGARAGAHPRGPPAHAGR